MSPLANNDELFEEARSTITLLTERNTELQRAYKDIRYELYNRLCKIKDNKDGTWLASIYNDRELCQSLDDAIDWCETKFNESWPIP